MPRLKLPPIGDTQMRWFLTIAAFSFGAGMAAIRIRYGAADFDVFWDGARHAFNPYAPSATAYVKQLMHIKGEWPFLYPPTFLLMVWPFAQLPLQIAYPLWAGLCFALFTLASTFMVRPVWANAALFMTPSLVFAVASGQSSTLLGAAAVGGFVLLERRPALAGVLLAVAACIKPQAMVLAPLVLWGRWRTMGSAAATGLALVAASCVFGPDLWLQWPKAIVAFQSVMPSLERVNPSALFNTPAWAIPVALFGVWLAWTQKNLFGLIMGAVCISPYAHDYDLAPLAPVALVWVTERKRLGWGPVIVGAVFLAGVVRSPPATLAFAVAAAVVLSPWWARRFGPSPSPLGKAPAQKHEGAPVDPEPLAETSSV